MQLAGVLVDIEGTTTPISFVHRVLFPYARRHLPAFCSLHADDPVIGEIARLVPDRPVLETLLGWMDEDAKITPLKTIQGMIWRQGYGRGELSAELYPDVAPALEDWAKAGLRLFVYSSGSVTAQKLLFSHTPDGDLSGLFEGFFDTAVGPKREPASYQAICRKADIAAAECLFLSDVEAELDAACLAGLQSCQLVRPADGTIASTRHPNAASFSQVAAMFELPRAPADR